MIDISFNLEGVEVTMRRLSGLEERAADPISPVADDLDKLFNQLMVDAFTSEGATTAAGKWKPLSKFTLADRKAEGWAPGPILQRTERLYRSLALGTPETIRAKAPLYWSRGTKVPYAKYHQSKGARKLIPRRALLDFTPQQIQSFYRVISVYLTGKKAAVKLRDRGTPRAT